MLVDVPQITVSETLFLGLARENPDVRFERASDGALIVVPPAGADSSRRNLAVVKQLATWNDARGGGVAFESSAGFRLPDGATRSPDAAWLPRSDWLRLSAAERSSFAPICPYFVAELLSPSDGLAETRAKLVEYIENGARLAWLIDPIRRVVEVYRPDREPEIHENPQTLDGEGELSGFTLDLTNVFD